MHTERKPRWRALTAMAVTGAAAAIALGAAPAAMADDTHAPPGSSTITVKVQNWAVFTGKVCLFREQPPGTFLDGADACTGDIYNGKQGQLTHTYMSPLKNGQVIIRGVAYGGNGADVAVGPGTHCFRFDGTTWAGFNFTEWPCNDTWS